MMSAMRIVVLSSSLRSGFSRVLLSRNMSNGSWGSGKGSGGGSEGSIREAGGAFGKREAAKEEEYFRRLSAQQLETLKTSLSDEITYHAEEIRDHELAIERHKKKLEELKKISE